MAARSKVDYESIEPDWRAGIKSVQQLADEYAKRTGVNVTHTAINKHFKKLGISRDLSAKIRARAEAKVSESIVSKRVPVETIVEANAENSAQIQIAERRDVTLARELTQKLMHELCEQTDNHDLYENLAELMVSSEDGVESKLREAFNRVISLPGRIKSLRELTDAMRIQIELERKVYKIDDFDYGAETYEEFLMRMHAVR